MGVSKASLDKVISVVILEVVAEAIPKVVHEALSKDKFEHVDEKIDVGITFSKTVKVFWPKKAKPKLYYMGDNHFKLNQKSKDSMRNM